MDNILIINENKNNEVGMVSECKAVIIRSKFIETRFWRASLPDCKPTKDSGPV